MEKVKTIFRTATRKATEKGSALLVSLMVLVGLSLLGLGFVALSETESSISVNQRSHAQAVAFAEAGARVVVQWFQDPVLARARGVMPVNTNAIKTERDVDGYVGYYKPDVATPELLCDTPYKPRERNRFYGTEDWADIVITEATAQTFLNTFNEKVFPPTALFGTDLRRRTQDSNLRISDIRIYAPPIVGGDPTDDGTGRFFWRGGTRYGVATIRVVAEQLHPVTHAVTARAIAKIVVAEFPVPHPLGPLQSASSLSTNGNFQVDWGMITADGDLGLKKNYSALPWFDAYDMAHFERGYDSSTIWAPGKAYPQWTVVRPTAASIAVKPQLATVEFVATTGGTSLGTEPATSGAPGTYWSATVGETTTDNSVTWTSRRPTVWPNDSSPYYNSKSWFYEMVNRTVEDPWFEVRTRQIISNIKGGSGLPQPYKYDQVTDDFWSSGGVSSHWFQYQDRNVRPEFKEVKFPAMDYDFWKAVAISANGQGGVRYLQYIGGNYSDGTATKSAESWMENGGPGYYFFDTTNGLNPQNGGGGTLGPLIAINGNIAGPMQGLFYLNNDFKTTGISPPDLYYNQPGEPYRDIGYRKVAEATGGGQTLGQWFTDPAGNFVLEGAFNNTHNHQDLAWSNGTGTKDGIFQVYMRQRSFYRESAPGTLVTEWLPVPYFPGCTPGTNAVLGNIPEGCSEPHEPYLNMRYTGAARGITVGWDNPTTVGYPKKNARAATLITCTTTSTVDECTSNAWDETGGLVLLPVSLDGVMYLEGGFYSTGNADYYGSIMANIVDNKGTPNIWFDQELLRNWPPKGFKLPRVMVTTVQTDQ
ncbi:MAG: hypothetical protein ACSLFQ_14330 [Thermoanaerobaculia bacterium]